MSDYSFRDITILHADQDVEWCKYLEGNFRLDKLKLHTLNVGQLCYNNPPEIEVAVRESYVVMLLVTSNFLTYMESKVDWFEPMLRKRDSEVTTVVAALVDIDNFPEEMGKLPYKDESRNSWAVIEIDVQGRNIKECITQILEILDKNSSKRNERSRKVSEHRAVDFEMIPSSIQGPGEKVAILFHEEMKGTVTVNIPGVKTDIPVKVVNPYSVTFIVPDVVVKDKVRVQVNVDGVKIKRVTLLNKSMMYHLTSIEFMCQSYGVASKEELDRKLADNFNKSLCNDGCAKQVLDDVMGNSSTGSIDHNNKFPTILHWAAANGLSEFCSALLSSVGSVVACGIVNCEGRDPADLARINNHHELYSLLVDFARESEFFKETKEMADTCDLYVKYCSQATGQKRQNSQDDNYVFPSESN
ncbi:B-cell scaffold protein with ankyrin repeats-like [Physella acuta]|uniref:B-cell scaffold protein with ankyrin repeats-like n=1 Tax=Physella acuta TaxID=109671 RepID=UPI0027DD6347|nr:B-cell scaffold protein with ankyrin repeats-like [Physella acuta]